MMMQHWCSSMTKENDAYGINQFDFLFYVPLCEITNGTDDIVDMIKTQLHMKYSGLVNDIFTNEPERVLILADGLDEWTSPKSNRHGIPKSSSAGEATIITTSRPSSRGILNMKFTDCDLKVTLLGLKDKDSMIKNYMKLLGKTSYIEAFNAALSNVPFKDIKNAPMMLQQIIWLYCNGYKIGQSRSSIYLHIVNAVLEWEYARTGAYPKLQSSRFEQHSLPKRFDKYTRCHENQEVLLLLGKIAYAAYITGDDSSLVFGRHKLKKLRISVEDIDTIVHTGILTEVNCADPTDKKSQLSFIHTSYVEFFAALYICSSYLSESSDSPSSNPFTILEGLIAVTPETSVTEILRLENVLIMICGLDPRLTEHVCECIYKLTPSDENADKNIKRQIQDLTYDCLSEHNSFDQKTVVKFKLRHLCMWFSFNRELSMGFSNLVPTSVETCSFSYIGLSHKQCLSLESWLSQAVSIRTLEVEGIRCTKDECEGHAIDLTDHKELKSIKLSANKISVSGIKSTVLESCDLYKYRLSHEQCTALSSCLSQATLLKKLTLYEVECIKPECEGHCIDLSSQNQLRDIGVSRCDIITLSEVNQTCLTNNKQLHRLHLSTCNTIFITGINPTCLEICNFRKCDISHEQCASLCTFLSQAESLQRIVLSEVKCIKDACEGHYIDLTNHKRLEYLDLSNSNRISITGINPACLLKECDISNCDLSHEQCASLCSFLSQAESLHRIVLREVKCIKDACEGHYIDLTNHKRLDYLKVSNCNMISITGTNPTFSKWCYISNCGLSHEQCASLCTLLSQAESSNHIELSGVNCIEDACEGHYIDLTNCKRLKGLDVQCCNMISVTGINPTCLRLCVISTCFLSHEQCASLCSSLSQAESLHRIVLSGVKCIEDACEDPYIDLTNHKQLDFLNVSNCYRISITGTNPIFSNICNIWKCDLSHEQCASLCSFLSHAESLHTFELSEVKCIEDACEGHYIDLTNCKRLEYLNVSNCNKISITGINTTCLLKVCDISNCDLSHEQCASLCSFLSQAESLEKIELSEVKCIEGACEGHYIDLTDCKRLQELNVSYCNMVSITGIKPTCLMWCGIRYCKLSHEQFKSLCTFPSKSINLRYNVIAKCTKEKCEGHCSRKLE